MILDARHIDPARPLAAAVCIVGSGAAGITLACELDGSGIDVLLLEAGPIAPRARVDQEAYDGSSEGAHPTPRNFRRLGFGGTTALWGGRCVPFDPIDFEPRCYIANSGWPIGYDEVARHYPKAMRYCDAGAFEFEAELAFGPASAARAAAVPGLDAASGIVADRIERYSLPTHFGSRYLPQLAASANVRLLGEAAVLELLPAADGARVDELRCRIGTRQPRSGSASPAQPAGRSLRVRAEAFVLAAGGIETTRLLLASRRAQGGLGNGHDNVGRYYSCHVENVIGVLRAVSPTAPQPAFHFQTTHDGVYARRKLQLAPEVQRRERIPNLSFRLHYPDVSNPRHGSAVLSAVFLAKRLLVPEYRRILQHGRGDGALPGVQAAHLRNVMFGLPRLAAFGADWLRRHTLAERKLPYVLVGNADGSHVLEFNAEQTPQRESRILLSDRLDADGCPRVHVHWRMAEDDIDGICRAYRLLRDAIAAGGASRLEFDDAALRDAVAASIPLGGHHIGSTRMAADPRHGVVDRSCAVFGLPNLFIASASVFPTSSHANPTLTIVALAIRLAAELRTRLAAPTATVVASATPPPQPALPCLEDTP